MTNDLRARAGMFFFGAFCGLLVGAFAVVEVTITRGCP
jgi:hypothetical protein